MESASGMLADLLGPLPDPLFDDSLVRSSDHDSIGTSMQRQVISRRAIATSHSPHATVNIDRRHSKWPWGLFSACESVRDVVEASCSFPSPSPGFRI
eukprot:4437905-Alexandrium_andersonii.AAC.1